MRAFPALFSLLALAAAASAAEEAIASPAKNWVLPLFTKEGFRSMTLGGTEVRPVGNNRLDVVDFMIRTFTGGANAKLDSMLMSPAATFLLEEKIARGDSSVRLLFDEIEILGEGWVYDHAAKKVSIAHKTHITFTAQLPDLIK